MRVVFVLVVTPPDYLPVRTVTDPDLRTVEPTTIAADDLAGKHAAAGVGTADLLTSRHLCLHRVKVIRVNDCRMGVLHL